MESNGVGLVVREKLGATDDIAEVVLCHFFYEINLNEKVQSLRTFYTTNEKYIFRFKFKNFP